MSETAKPKRLTTSRLSRFATLARAGLGTAASAAVGSSSGIEHAVERLGELRGIGTKVGQMAGLVEANLAPELRAKIGPALATLRAQAASSPYDAVAQIVLEDLGQPPEKLFTTFDSTPFASASLGQVHRATHANTTPLAVKIQHPGIRDAFTGDLENVTSLGRVATTLIMPDGQGKRFLDGVKAGFLAELDYVREGENLREFAALLSEEPDLEVPILIADRSSARVLTTTFLRGDPVETARTYDTDIRVRQAAAIRRLVLSSLADHGLLYADAHAGNFLFREDGTIGVLDFGSVLRFEDARREDFARLRDAAAASDRGAFEHAVAALYGIENTKVITAIADVQWLGFGGLVRGDRIDPAHIRAIMDRAGDMKRKLLGQRFTLPSFLPFLMRTLVATNALLVALDAPASGPLTRIRARTG